MLRLDFSSPSLSVLSPFYPGASTGTAATPAGTNSGAGEQGTAGGGNEKEKSEKIKEENNQNESPAQNQEKAALVATRKRVRPRVIFLSHHLVRRTYHHSFLFFPAFQIIMASKENPLKSSNNSNNITPSPGSNHPRRSSRLFGSTQSSVKENSKAPTKKARAPKSPSRKSKPPRIALLQSDLDEKNEKNKASSP